MRYEALSAGAANRAAKPREVRESKIPPAIQANEFVVVSLLPRSKGFTEFSGFSRTLNHTPNHNSTTKDDQEPRITINLPLPKPTL